MEFPYIVYVWRKFVSEHGPVMTYQPQSKNANHLTPVTKESECNCVLCCVSEPTGSMPPRLTQRSVTLLSAEQGADVHLSCAAQGNPPPSFT